MIRPQYRNDLIAHMQDYCLSADDAQRMLRLYPDTVSLAERKSVPAHIMAGYLVAECARLLRLERDGYITKS